MNNNISYSNTVGLAYEYFVLEQIKKDWNIQEFKNIIGLHFRKGDKINESVYMSEDFVVNFIKENLIKLL